MTPHWFKIYKSKPRKKSKYSLVLHLQMGRRWGHSTTHKKITFSTQIELIKNVLKNLIVLSSKLQHQIEIFLSPKLIDIILSPVYSESIKFSLLSVILTNSSSFIYISHWYLKSSIIISQELRYHAKTWKERLIVLWTTSCNSRM